MDRLTKLRQKRAEAIKKMRELHTLADSEDRELTEEEQTSYDGHRTQIESLDREIKREEELRALEGTSDDPEIRVVEDEEEKKSKPGVWKHLGEQLQAVQRAAQPNGSIDPRLSTRAATGASEGVATDGGFLVQTDFSEELFRRAVEVGVLAPRVRRVGVSGNGLKMNAVDESSRADGSRWGGVAVYWENEADEYTASKPKFTQMEWKLKKLVGLCYATDELMEDTAALGSVMSQAFAEEFAFKIDDAIIRGTGTGQPLGILNSPCTLEVTKVTSQAASSVVGGNILDMRARLWARSRPNSVWLVNQDCEPTLHKLNVVGDTGVTEFLVYMPAGGVSGSPYDTLYGRPVIPIEQASTVGTVGDIILADLSQYLLIDKGGLSSDVSIHVRFLYGETAFRWQLRIDGSPMWPTPITPAQGSNAQSPFITLAARA